jgi:hypothetical protein
VARRIAVIKNKRNMKKSSTRIKITPVASRITATMQNTSHTNISACCDIIDNSLDVNANVIRLHVRPSSQNKDKYELVIIDNGCGMTQDELRSAVTLGGHKNNDNGRGIFGVGLVIACGHYSNEFDVYTKLHAQSDILHVNYNVEKFIDNNEWDVPMDCFSNIEADEPDSILKILNEYDSGTAIVICDTAKINDDNVQEFIDNVSEIIGIEYKNYLAPKEHPDTKRNLKIYINDKEIYGLDLLERHLDATEVPIDETYQLEGGGSMRIIHSILPYASIRAKQGKKLNNVPIKTELWNFPPSDKTQGAYIYRNGTGICNSRRNEIFTFLNKDSHNAGNYNRSEIQYVNADNHFKVNMTKTDITWISNEVKNILTLTLKSAMLISRKLYLANLGGVNDPDAVEFKKRYNKVAQESQSKLPRKRINKKKTILNKKKKLTMKQKNLTVVSADMKKNGKFWAVNNKTNCLISFNDKHAYHTKYIQSIPDESKKIIGEVLFSLSDNMSKIAKKYPELIDMINEFEDNVSNDLRLLAKE